MEIPTGREGVHCTISKSVATSGSDSDRSTGRWAWYSIVKEYGRRSLTEPEDKLPALSGVAAWLLGHPKVDYLAGLLRDDIHYGLAWWARPPSQAIQQPHIYRAPSWSWASTDYPVEFITLTPVKIPRSGTDLETRHRMHNSMSQNRIKVCDAYAKINGRNTFGGVTTGAIKPCGMVRIGTVTGSASNLMSKDRYGVRHEVDLYGTAYFYPDDIDRWQLLSDNAGTLAGNRASAVGRDS